MLSSLLDGKYLLPLIPMIPLKFQVKALSLAAAGTAAIGAVFWALAPAEAANFNFSYSGVDEFSGAPVNASGILTTDPVNTTLVTGISGRRNGALITALAPVGTSDNNDNRLYPNFPQLDGGGISYSTAPTSSNGPTSFNVYYGTGGRSQELPIAYYEDSLNQSGLITTQAKVNFSATPVPAPAVGKAWLVVGGLGWLMKRKVAQLQKTKA